MFIDLLTNYQSEIIRVGIIVLLGWVLHMSVSRFGKQVLMKALTTRKTGLHRKEIMLSQDDEQRIETLSAAINQLTRLIIVLVAGTMILAELQVNIGPIIAGAGVLGVALGFGAQSLVKDVLTGVFILIENQYVKGDIIKINDISGTVVELSLRRTVLRDINGVEHHVPNGEITVASNYTKDWANINMDVSISYDDDMEMAITVLNTVAEELANNLEWKASILEQPSVLGVQELSSSSVVLRLKGKVIAEKQWAIERELNKRIKIAFDTAGISIPYQQIVVSNGVASNSK